MRTQVLPSIGEALAFGTMCIAFYALAVFGGIANGAPAQYHTWYEWLKLLPLIAG